MADNTKTPALATKVSMGEPAATSGPAELPQFRFRLRQLLLFVALLSIFLTAIVSSQGIVGLALVLAVLVMTAHVFSTALGSRLRCEADRAQGWNGVNRTLTANGSGQPFRRPSAVSSIPSQRRSPWHRRGSTSMPWLPRLIVAGTLLGGLGGALVLLSTIGDRTSLAGVLLGGFSLAVLGGWFAFLGGSFYGIFRHGVREALADPHRDETNP
jgi:hypothetical protein